MGGGNTLEEIRDILNQTLSQFTGQNATIIDLLRRQSEDARKASVKPPAAKEKTGQSSDLDRFSKDWKVGLDRMLGERGIGGLIKKITQFGSQWDTMMRGANKPNVAVGTGAGGAAAGAGGALAGGLANAKANLKTNQTNMYNAWQATQSQIDEVKKAAEDMRNAMANKKGIIERAVQWMEDRAGDINPARIDDDGQTWGSKDEADASNKEIAASKALEDLTDAYIESAKAYKENREKLKKEYGELAPFEKLKTLLNTSIGIGAGLGYMVGGKKGALLGGFVGAVGTQQGRETTKEIKQAIAEGFKFYQSSTKSEGGIWDKIVSGSNALDKAIKHGVDFFNFGPALNETTLDFGLGKRMTPDERASLQAEVAAKRGYNHLRPDNEVSNFMDELHSSDFLGELNAIGGTPEEKKAARNARRRAAYAAKKAAQQGAKMAQEAGATDALGTAAQGASMAETAGATEALGTAAATGSDAIVMAEIVGEGAAAGGAAATGAAAGAAGTGATVAAGTAAAATGPPGWVIGAIAIGLTLMAKGTMMAVAGLRKMNEEVVKSGLTFANYNADMAMIAGSNEVRETVRSLKSGAYRSKATKFANDQNQEFQDRTRVFGDMWHNFKSYMSGAATWVENRMIQTIMSPLEGLAATGGLIYAFLTGDLNNWLKDQDKLEDAELNGPYANMLLAMADNPGWGNNFMDRKAGFKGRYDDAAPPK